MPFTLSSPAFGAGQSIPRRYTCDGEDVSPPLAWSGVPEGTASLALIMEDPDAPDPAAPRRIFVDWVVTGLPPSLTGLPEGASGGQLPAGAREGRNDMGGTGYNGPCPSIGRHRYYFRLFALDAEPEVASAQPTKAELEAAMAGHVLATAELVGTYER